MPNESIVCPNGHANDAGTKFCVVCGLAFAIGDSVVGDSVAGDPSPRLAPEPPAHDAAPAAPRGRKRLWTILAGAAALVVVVALGLYFVLTAAIPDLSKATPSAAQAQLVAAGFSVGGRSKEFSDSVPRGAVVSQSPQAGARSRKGSSVSLVISRGPAAITPEVEGLAEPAARTALSDATLTSKSESVVSETVPEGQVIRQEPSAGTKVEEGTNVHLVVSAGPPRIDVTAELNLDSTVLALDWGDCSLAVLLWSTTYPSAVIVNRSGETLSKLSGRWTADPGNGKYLPCKITGVFPDTSTVEDEYRINLSPTNPEENSTPWFTRAELEASNWRLRTL